jgi:hypothetical protein
MTKNDPAMPKNPNGIPTRRATPTNGALEATLRPSLHHGLRDPVDDRSSNESFECASADAFDVVW